MKRYFCLPAVFSLLCTMLSAQAVFQHTYSDLSNTEASSTIQTTDGGFLVCGITGSGVFGPYRAKAIKTDADGNIQWAKSYYGTVSDYLARALQNPDGTYMLVGTTFSFNTQPYGNVLLMKIDASGNLLWTRHYGGTGYEYGNDIIHDGSGGYFIGGLTSSFGAGNNDLYVLHVDSAGNPFWASAVGGAAMENANSLVLAADGNVMLAGNSNSYGQPVSMVVPHEYFLVKINASNGNLIWSNIYGTGVDVLQCAKLIRTHDDGYMMVGFNGGSGDNNVYVVKTDSAGNSQWRKSIGTTAQEYGYSVVQMPDHSYYIGGYSEGFSASRDMYLLHLDSSGNYLTGTIYGDTATESATDIIRTSDNALLLTGYRKTLLTANSKAYLVKCDLNNDSGCDQDDASSTVYAMPQHQTPVTPGFMQLWNSIPVTPTVATGATLNVLCSTVGMAAESLPGESILLYPNPAKTDFTVESPEPIRSLSVTDLSGRLMMRIERVNSRSNRIDCSAFPQGLYLVILETEKGRTARKMLVGRD